MSDKTIPKELSSILTKDLLERLSRSLTGISGVPFYFATTDGHLLTETEQAVDVCARMIAGEDIERPCLDCPRTALDADGESWDVRDGEPLAPCPGALVDFVVPIRCGGKVVCILGTGQFTVDPDATREALAPATPPDVLDRFLEQLPVVTPDRVSPLRDAVESVSKLVFDLLANEWYMRQATTTLEKAARTDPLTGAGNRREAMRVLDELGSLAARHRRPFALLSFDIDHFKQINDTFGHGVGDRVLIEFTQLLIERARPSDHVFRMGGEEFLVVCYETTPPGAVALAERLRTLVEAHAFPVADLSPVTVSVGVTCWDEHRAPNIDALLASADAALYAAKDAGRNCVSQFRE